MVHFFALFFFLFFHARVCAGVSTGAELPMDITHAFSLSGQHLAWAILFGIKFIENRNFRMRPGWYAVACTQVAHVGVTEDRAYKDKFKSYPGFQSLESWKGKVVGICRVSHSLPHSECKDDFFACENYKVKNIIAEVMPIDVLIPAKGNLGTWPLSDAVKKELRKAIQSKFEECAKTSKSIPIVQTMAPNPSNPSTSACKSVPYEAVAEPEAKKRKLADGKKEAPLCVLPKPPFKRPKKWTPEEEAAKAKLAKLPNLVHANSGLSPNNFDIRSFFKNK